MLASAPPSLVFAGVLTDLGGVLAKLSRAVVMPAAHAVMRDQMKDVETMVSFEVGEQERHAA